jgi:hypothetical protein
LLDELEHNGDLDIHGLDSRLSPVGYLVHRHSAGIPSCCADVPHQRLFDDEQDYPCPKALIDGRNGSAREEGVLDTTKHASTIGDRIMSAGVDTRMALNPSHEQQSISQNAIRARANFFH